MAKTILIVLILAGALALVVGCERDSAERPADDAGSTGAVSTEGGQQSATSSDSGLSAKPDAEAYIQMAMESSVGKDLGLSLFPKKPKTTVCVIPGGGPPPGIRVPGTCSTTVRLGRNDEATVRFVEHWDARRFHGPGTGGRRRLSHTWELTVSPHAPAGARVVATRDYGDFPPRLVK
jgi:hypothetical protein